MKRASIILLLLSICCLSLSAQNYALSFSSNNDVVQINQQEVSGSWTAECWVYKTASSAFSTLIDGESGKITLESWGNNGNVGITQKGVADWAYNYVVPVGEWIHLAFTCNDNSTKLYVNGSFNQTLNQKINLPLSFLGQPNESPSMYLDEVRLWDYEKTASEIADYYNQSVSLTAEGLLAYWYFDDQATNATDISSSQFDGLIDGPTYILNDNSNFTTTFSDMSLAKVAAYNDNEYFVKPGSDDQAVLKIVINTEGLLNPITLNSLIVNLNGSSNLSDISSVKLYATERSEKFATDNAVGSSQLPTSDNLTFSENMVLQPGDNYFWLAYDVPSNATLDNLLDGEFISTTIDNEVHIPAETAPVGSRKILNEIPQHQMAWNAVIPKPQNMTLDVDSSFLLTDETLIVVTDSTLGEGEKLSNYLQTATGYPFTVENVSTAPTEGNISLSILDTYNDAIGTEGYLLDVDGEGVRIQGNTLTGVFYGWQTLRQLLPNVIESPVVVPDQEWPVTFVEIEDYPRFPWRGLHLDVCRHIFSVDFIKKYLDAMAMNKLNYFHWHLTEDQGWRIEILGRPELQTISAYRDCDGEIYGGFYTQEEVADIVAYAMERHITVVPEIEMPGHSVEVLAAYPELSCATDSGPYGGPFEVRCAWGVSEDIFCAGKEATFEFIEEVLTEVVAMFPGPYIHLGGDEAPKVRWEACSDCQARIDAEGLDDEEELQKYFMERVGEFLATHNKEWIGWSEITAGGVPENATVMSWLGESSAITAAQQSHDAILAPFPVLYLDAPNSSDASEPPSIGYAPNTLSKIYNYDPMPAGLTTAQQQYILGPHSPLWTEYIIEEDHAEYMILPRIYALAEIGWSANVKDYQGFLNRLSPKFERLDLLDYNYRPLDPISGADILIPDVATCQEDVLLEVNLPASSCYWNDAQNSTTPSITVEESGLYKVYIDYFGEILEGTSNVAIKSPPVQPSVQNIPAGAQQEWTALGDADAYFWYDDMLAEVPLFSGNPYLLDANESPSDYYVVGAQMVNKIGEIHLQGGQDHVAIDDVTFLNEVDAFTFETWINVHEYETWDKVLSKTSDLDQRVSLELADGSYYLEIGNGANSYAFTSPLAVATDQWQHIAMVYDGSGGSNTDRLKFYINGELMNLSFNGTIPTVTPTNNIQLTIGDLNANPNMEFTSTRFWNKALNESEILFFKDQVLDGSENGLVYYFKTATGSGDVLLNEVNNNHATIVNQSPANWDTSILPFMLFDCKGELWNVGQITSLVKPIEELGFKIFPNPSSGNFTFSMELSKRKTIKTKLFDSSGQLVFQKEYPDSLNVLDHLNLDHLVNGSYIFQVEKEGETESTILLIQN